MKKLHLTHRQVKSYPGGLWYPVEDPKQKAVFMHFTGGNIAIPHDRLKEITLIAEAHGWEVITAEATDPCTDGMLPNQKYESSNHTTGNQP